MCRWISYSGNPIPLNTLIAEPEISLIDQSLSSRMGVHPTNGDGFGVGWYGRNNEPGIYRSVYPAWNDENLKQIGHHIEAPIFLAHIRRSTGTAVQPSNCHPFQFANWIFVHNGLIRDFDKIHRELLLAVDPKYFTHMRGGTDSELIFFLALTFGLQENPKLAVEKAIGLVESVGKAHGIEFPMQGSLGFSNGEQLYAVRYSSEKDSRSLFYSEAVCTLKKLLANTTARADMFDDTARAVVSEPLGDIPGVWLPVPESSFLTVHNGEVDIEDFVPQV